MSLEVFQLLDNEPIDNSIIKRDFLKIHYQQGANLNDPHQNVEFISGEINNYHQIRNAYLEFDITVCKADGNISNFDPAVDEVLRFVNNNFAFCFKEATLVTTGSSDLEHNKQV